MSGGFQHDAVSPVLDNEVIRTDANGKWHFENAPARLDRFNVTINKPGFQVQNFSSIPEAQLRAETYTAVVKRHVGIDLNGVVLDPAGKPVMGARVVFADDRSSQRRTFKTGTDGQFHFQNAPDDQHLLTVTAAGYGPAQVSLADKSNTANAERYGPEQLEHFASCWRASRRKMLLLSLKGVTAWKPIRRKFEN